jgi:uncharacterized protein
VMVSTDQGSGIRGQGWLLAAAMLALPLVACGRAPETSSYLADTAAARATKDNYFRTGSDSPVPPERRDEFLPLAYFPIDPDYSVPAVLEPVAAGGQQVVQMPTSTGQTRMMRLAGTLQFTLNGRALKLGAFVEDEAPGGNRLFVPFTDLTTGAETYVAGRYIDLDRTATGIYAIDFNQAYHPYCYYNPTYDCPYPPPGNRLPVPIRAGERLRRPAISR